MPAPLNRHPRRSHWLIIIGIVLLLHLILFVSVRPDFFSAFRRSLSGESDDAAPRFAAMPDAIITIPIEIVDDAEDAIEPDQDTPEPTQHEPPLEKKHADSQPAQGSNHDDVAFDVQDLVGEALVTQPGDPGTPPVSIPPRPVEIVWPDTRGLKHCLGYYINVRILVDADGSVLDVEAQPGDFPEDCLAAAVRSARQIVFEPGRTDGVPARMWTQVRIDFRRRR